MRHSFITIFIPFPSRHIAEVQNTLSEMGNPASRSDQNDIRTKLRKKGIHFTSGTVIPDDSNVSHILLELSADGSHQAALNVYADSLSDNLLKILQSANLEVGATELSRFLKRHLVNTGQGLFDLPGLNFTGTPDMSVARILAEKDLAREIRDYFDRTPPSESALETVKNVRGHIASVSTLSHLLKTEPMPFAGEEKPFDIFGILISAIGKFLWPLLLISALITIFALNHFWGAGFGAIVTTLIISTALTLSTLILAAALLYRALRTLEKNDVADNSLPDFDVLNAVTDRENKTQQNHMTGVSIMKPGLIRKLMLRLVFWVIGFVARTSFRPGYLADIGTIHFARWAMIPKTNKLIFLSNYGGSWGSYLEDFITKANAGLTGVWSNTYGFPKAKNLFLEGATDGERFKRWARRQQIPTLFWYSAYPSLQTSRIRKNAKLRYGLASVNTEGSASQWLSIYASDAMPANVIEKDKVQSLLFGGMAKHPHGVCISVKLSDLKSNSQKWLEIIAPKINYGNVSLDASVIQLALTATGLRKLGLSNEELHSFPHAFVQGMNHPVRSKNILFDTGEDNPELWSWGNSKQAVDAAILIYAVDKPTITKVKKAIGDSLKASEGQIVGEVIMSDVKPGKFATEPFGFADGISQPIIRGARPKRTTDNQIHVVEPGEFILGYTDNHGNIPNSPTIDSLRDPSNILPVLNIDIDIDHLNFDNDQGNAIRDLGKNGSFLVVRQIEQNQELFDNYIKQQAEKIANHPGLPKTLNTPEKRKDWVGAKLIGRWKDGTSLIRHPNKPGIKWSDGTLVNQTNTEPDNDFLFGEEDPIGHGCPFGAHIRRSNPRDSLNPNAEDQLAITNRHRILRRGRTYVAGVNEKIAKEDRGLLFMCLNGDIERQFEFIQQTWNMSLQFHGLENEVDPIMGRGGDSGRMTIPTLAGPIQFKDMKDFTKICGGGYFFLPGRLALQFLCQA